MRDFHSQSIMNAPTNSYACMYGTGFDASDPTPLCNGLSDSIVCEPHVLPRVVGLFNRCSPLHVARFIIAIVVLALNHVRRTRTWADMVEKGHEVVSPLVTDFYSACSVVVIHTVLQVVAPIFHLLPDGVLGWECAVVANAQSVLHKSLTGRFITETATRAYVSFFDVAQGGRVLISTIAKALGYSITQALGFNRDDKESSVLLSNGSGSRLSGHFSGCFILTGN